MGITYAKRKKRSKLGKVKNRFGVQNFIHGRKMRPGKRNQKNKY